MVAVYNLEIGFSQTIIGKIVEGFKTK